jgi:hypothetical protein
MATERGSPEGVVEPVMRDGPKGVWVECRRLRKMAEEEMISIFVRSIWGLGNP